MLLESPLVCNNVSVMKETNYSNLLVLDSENQESLALKDH